jgi:hypothetical protein
MKDFIWLFHISEGDSEWNAVPQNNSGFNINIYTKPISTTVISIFQSSAK